MKEWPRVPPQPPADDEPENPERRRFLGGAIAGAALGAGAVAAGAAWANKVSVKNVDEFFTPSEGPHSKEGFRGHKPSELFTKQTEGYATLYGKLHRDEALFVDEDGAPLELVKLEPYTPTSTEKGESQQAARLLPGKGDAQHQFDSSGFLMGEPNPDWVEAQRMRICAAHPGVKCDPENELPRMHTVTNLLRGAADTSGQRLNPETYLDLVKHFGEKEVEGGGGLNHIQYIQKHALENTNLPPALKAELKPLVVGLAAQESRFDNTAVSNAGAVGIFQFLPSVWEAQGRKPEEISSFVAQVEEVGKYFETAYKQFLHFDERGVLHTKDKTIRHAGVLEHIKQAYFDGDEDAFMKHFLAPVLINSYNAGPAGVYEVAAWYADNVKSRGGKHPAYPEGYGHDLFHHMTANMVGKKGEGHHSDSEYQYIGGYKQHAGEYTPRVYAFAQLLSGEKKESAT